MHSTLPRLRESDFPALHRAGLETLQVNLGYRCNQSCLHCHVAAGPHRKEMMSEETARCVLRFLEESGVSTLDITGGAPELNPVFRPLVQGARALGVHVIDRCNLTILLEPGQEDLGAFLAGHDVEVVASLPCYLEENVDAQRGRGVFGRSIEAMRRLNALGYGLEGAPAPGRSLSLVYNPQGPVLPPPQGALEDEYRRHLSERYGIHFTRLLVLANLPVGRFGSTLISRGELDGYLGLLQAAHREENLDSVMCRRLISVDWRGYVYDCDFNQMMGLHMPGGTGGGSVHLSSLVGTALEGRPIRVGMHCYGCTAGQGSSCSGALAS